MQTALFAGGCFWCLEAVFASIKGVNSVKSGYTAGHTEQPTYAQVCTGQTGHTEAVQIDFDEHTISYTELLTIFFAIHNPTTLNRQGNDVGTQYRSGIYYLDEAQQAAAQTAIAQAQTQYAEPIVTELQAASTFYPAESEHDDYFRLHPYQGYCQLVIAPKVLHAREEFAHHWRQD